MPRVDPIVRHNLKKYYRFTDREIDFLFGLQEQSREKGPGPSGGKGKDLAKHLKLAIVSQQFNSEGKKIEKNKKSFLDELRNFDKDKLKSINNDFSAEIDKERANAAMVADEVPELAGQNGVDLATDILGAVIATVNHWRSHAFFRDVRIVGATAIGNPGCLGGVNIVGQIYNHPKLLKGRDGVPAGRVDLVSNAVLKGFVTSFSMWQDMFVIPSLPMYPAFAFFHGPYAPPTPNQPMPLSSFDSGGVTWLTSPSTLARNFLEAVPRKHRTPGLEVFLETIAKAVASSMSVWLSTQVVTNVLGHGAVSLSGSPGNVGGPVLDGTVLPIPGAFAEGSGPPAMVHPLMDLLA